MGTVHAFEFAFGSLVVGFDKFGPDGGLSCDVASDLYEFASGYDISFEYMHDYYKYRNGKSSYDNLKVKEVN